MEKKYKVYKLIYNSELIYIGRTINSFSRRRSSGYKETCLFGHFGDNLREVISQCHYELIEETTDISRERYWIEYYLSVGCSTLLNISKGVGGLTVNITEYRKNKYNTDKGTDTYKEYCKNYRDIHKEYNKEYHKKYYKVNKDTLNDNAKEYRSTQDKEKVANYMKEYYKANKDKWDEYNKKRKI